MKECHHYLAEEFPEFKEKIHQLKMENAHFQRLCNEYESVDKEIGRLENRIECSSENEEHELRKKRLSLKDQLFAMLQQA